MLNVSLSLAAPIETLLSQAEGSSLSLKALAFPVYSSSSGRYYSNKSKNTTKKLVISKYEKLEKDNSFIIENISDIKHPILLEYLKYRKINHEAASRYGLKEINYQIWGLPDSHYFALAWFNDSGGCEFNSRKGDKSFKGCLGAKDITTINLKPNKKIVIFESAPDF